LLLHRTSVPFLPFIYELGLLHKHSTLIGLPVKAHIEPRLVYLLKKRQQKNRESFTKAYLYRNYVGPVTPSQVSLDPEFDSGPGVQGVIFAEF
jgi:hypothetical protein